MSESSSDGDLLAWSDVVMLWVCSGASNSSTCEDDMSAYFELVTCWAEEADGPSCSPIPPETDELGEARALPWARSETMR